MKEEIDDELTKVEKYNKIYSEKGFNGVIQTLEDNLHLGRISWKPNGIVCVTTGGWSDDEEIIHNLIHIVSQFGHNHYLGYVVGGAYYFSEERDCGYVAIQKELSDYETSNPSICQWCKYSCDGKRDAGRSITMCDGCRYNEEFEHKPFKVKNNGQIIVDKELLREQLMSIVGTCSDCDMKHGIHCNKEACGYGLSDKLIDEIINNCIEVNEK